MRALGASRTSVVPGGVLAGNWARDPLWTRARAVPSLDLNFAGTKTLDSRVTFTRASTGTYVGSDGAIKTATTNEARFDHNPTTGESLGLLVEEARTNLMLRSEEFDNASWNVVPAILTVTANTQTAPNGTLTADTIATVSSTSALFQTVACAASTVYTWSFYVKLGTMAATDFRFAVRDDSNGAFIGSDITPNVTPVTTEWRRVTYTFTTPVGCVLVRPYPYRATPATYGTTAFIWGAQLEQGAFPTSYIPTAASTVTRAADLASMTGTNFSSWYNQTEGSLFCEYNRPSAVTSLRSVVAVSDGGFTNRTTFRTDSATELTIFTSVGGVSQTVFPLVVIPGANNRSVGAYKVNDYNAAANGVIGVNDTSATVPVVNQLSIGSVLGAEPSCSYIRRLTFWPVRLPNATLQAITQP